MSFKLKMLSVVTMSVVGFGASFASANCSDQYIADCGSYKLLSTTCPTFNGDGEVSGFEETLRAVVDQPVAAEHTFKAALMHKRAPGKAFRAKKDVDTDIYLLVDAGAYSTWEYSRGVVGEVKACTVQ